MLSSSSSDVISQYEVVLKLFFNNPFSDYILDEQAKIEYTYTHEQLFMSANQTIRGFRDGDMVSIVYMNDMFTIQTEADVDIFINGNIASSAVHIVTAGGVVFKDRRHLQTFLDISICAHSITLDVESANINVLMLHATGNYIHFKKSVTASRLYAKARIIEFDSMVQANAAYVDCKKIKVHKDAALSINHGGAKPIIEDSQQANMFFAQMHQELIKKLDEAQYSILSTDSLICDGKLKVVKTLIRGVDIKCEESSTVLLDKSMLMADNAFVARGASISGNQTRILVKNNLHVYGSIIINILLVYARTMDVPGILYGEEFIYCETSENIQIDGIIGAEHAQVEGKHLYITATSAQKKLFRNYWHHGGIIGTKTLSVHSVTNTLIGGGFLSSPRLTIKSGLTINILGYFRSCDFSNKSVINLDAGLHIPSMPGDEAYTWQNILKVAKFTAGNVPHLRVLMNMHELYKLTEYSFSNLRSYTPVAKTVLKDGAAAIGSRVKRLPELAGDFLKPSQHSNELEERNSSYKESLKGVVDGVADKWNQTSSMQLIDYLLSAQDLYIQGNRIMSQGKNVVAFAKQTLSLKDKLPPAIVQKYTSPDGGELDVLMPDFDEIGKFINTAAASFGQSVVNIDAYALAFDALSAAGPQVTNQSYFSQKAGVTIAGSSSDHAILAGHHGFTAAISNNTNCMLDYHNSGHIFAASNHINVRDFSNSGQVKTFYSHVNARDVHERGVHTAHSSLQISMRNFIVAQDALIESQGETFVTGLGDFSIGGKIVFVNGSISIKCALDIKRDADVGMRNMAVFAKRVTNDGNWHHSDALHVETEYLQSTEGSTFTSADEALFSVKADDIDLSGNEHYYTAIMHLKNTSTNKCIQIAIGLDKNNNVVKDCIWISTEQEDVGLFAGFRKDGAMAQVETNGYIILGDSFARAKGDRFQNYQIAGVIVNNYHNYKLPPPPKPKKGFWRRLNKIATYVLTASSNVSALCGQQALASGLAVAAYASHRLTTHHDCKDDKKMEAAEIANANAQKMVNTAVIQAQKDLAIKGVASSEQIQKLENIIARNSRENETEKSEARLKQGKSRVDDDFNKTMKELDAALADLINQIKEFHAERRDTIRHAPGPKVGVGVGVNAGSSGYDIGLTTTVGTTQQTLSTYTPLFNKDFRTPTTALPGYSPPRNSQDNDVSNEESPSEPTVSNENSESGKVFAIEDDTQAQHAPTPTLDNFKQELLENSAANIDLSIPSDTSQGSKFHNDTMAFIHRHHKDASNQLEALNQQLYQLSNSDIANVDYDFRKHQNRESYDKAKQRYERLFPEFKQTDQKYSRELQSLESETLSHHEKALRREQLENTIGMRRFLQRQALDALQRDMLSYVKQDIAQQINANKTKLDWYEYKSELMSSSKRDSGREDYQLRSIEYSQFVREVYLRADAFMLRHAGLMVTVQATALAMNPVASLKFLAIFSALSLTTRGKIQQSLTNLLRKGGAGKFASEDISAACTDLGQILFAGNLSVVKVQELLRCYQMMRAYRLNPSLIPKHFKFMNPRIPRKEATAALGKALMLDLEAGPAFTPRFAFHRSLLEKSRLQGLKPRVPKCDPELLSQWAEVIYADIRSWGHRWNTQAVARNSGISENIIDAVRHHTFLTKHHMPSLNEDTGTVSKIFARFSADSEIARLWDRASCEYLTGDDLSKFLCLIAHEYVELRLMELGLVYRSCDAKAVRKTGSFYCLYFAPEAYGAHDIAPLASRPRENIWDHWKLPGMADAFRKWQPEIDQLMQELGMEGPPKNRVKPL